METKAERSGEEDKEKKNSENNSETLKRREDCLKLLEKEKTEEHLWETLVAFEGYPFHTVKGLEFTYAVKGGELFIDRKENSKSLTKSTVLRAFHDALEKDGPITGPKKMTSCFGATYLYAMFWRWGLIRVPLERARGLLGMGEK